MRLDDALSHPKHWTGSGSTPGGPSPAPWTRTDVFFLCDRTRVDVTDLGPAEACRLLGLLILLRLPLHEQAACDGESTASRALEWGPDGLGVEPVYILDHRVWLESTAWCGRCATGWDAGPRHAGRPRGQGSRCAAARASRPCARATSATASRSCTSASGSGAGRTFSPACVHEGVRARGETGGSS